MTAILLSSKSHALRIMHLILITKKCAKIFNFTIETSIRLLNLKRRHYGNRFQEQYSYKDVTIQKSVSGTL